MVKSKFFFAFRGGEIKIVFLDLSVAKRLEVVHVSSCIGSGVNRTGFGFSVVERTVILPLRPTHRTLTLSFLKSAVPAAPLLVQIYWEPNRLQTKLKSTTYSSTLLHLLV